MRIVKENEFILIIKDRNVVGYSLGSVFVLFGIFFLNPSLFGRQPNAPTFNNPTMVALLSLLLGASAILLPTIDSATFDKIRNKLVTRQRSLFWNKQRECSLSQIQEICLWLDYSNSDPIYRLVCVLEDGSEFGLNPTKSSSTISGRFGLLAFIKIPDSQIGKKISTFLNVPFEQRHGAARGT